MKQSSSVHFDYIIAGAGCAGLSMALRMLNEPQLAQKKIAIIDASKKNENDRTWCFWESGQSFFENIVYHRWSKLVFHTPEKSIPLSISPYQYKMIRGLDFYQHAQTQIQQNHNQIHWIKEKVEAIGNLPNGRAFALANGIEYTADYVFNSIWFEQDRQQFNLGSSFKLLQHFKGWVIETDQPTFNLEEACFMDFRVDQELGTTFVYVLPVSTTRALVEYTYFNEKLLSPEAYDGQLKQYLKVFWHLEQYQIIETEFGIIPMTNHSFKRDEGGVINIGTAGGWTKPSSGFTFQFIQKNTATLVAALVAGKKPVVQKNWFQKRFSWYDATLLHVLHHQLMEGKTIFYHLFSKLAAHKVLQFLDDETNLLDEIQILNAVPTRIFLPAAFQELLPNFLKRQR